MVRESDRCWSTQLPYGPNRSKVIEHRIGTNHRDSGRDKQPNSRVGHGERACVKDAENHGLEQAESHGRRWLAEYCARDLLPFLEVVVLEPRSVVTRSPTP